jgi:hypothetical protein
MHASSEYFHRPDKVLLKILVYNKTGQEIIWEREIKQDSKRALGVSDTPLIPSHSQIIYLPNPKIPYQKKYQD